MDDTARDKSQHYINSGLIKEWSLRFLIEKVKLQCLKNCLTMSADLYKIVWNFSCTWLSWYLKHSISQLKMTSDKINILEQQIWDVNKFCLLGLHLVVSTRNWKKTFLKVRVKEIYIQYRQHAGLRLHSFRLQHIFLCAVWARTAWLLAQCF